MTNPAPRRQAADQAEQATIGALLWTTNPGLLVRVIGIAPPEQYHHPHNAAIVRAIINQFNSDLPHDMLSVTERLLSDDPRIFEQIGGTAYLATCAEQGQPEHGTYHAGIVHRDWLRRKAAEQVAQFRQAVETGDLDQINQARARIAAAIPETDDTDTSGQIDWSVLQSADFASVPWYTRPLLAPGELITLVGAGKSGKSLFCYEWAGRLSAGQPFLDNPAGQPVRVLYIDQENSHPELQRRMRTVGFKPDELDNLVYLSFPPIGALDTATGAASLVAAVKRYTPDVVFLDTVSRMITGEENSADTWLQVYRQAHLPLRAMGVACVRLDHFGKDATRGSRGSSAKTQDVDHVWELAKIRPDTLSLRRTHSRSGIGADRLLLQRTGRPDQPGTTAHLIAPPLDPAQEERFIIERRIVQALDAAGVPVDAGRERIRAVLKEAGIRMRNEDLADLIRRRREADPQLALAEGIGDLPWSELDPDTNT